MHWFLPVLAGLGLWSLSSPNANPNTNMPKLSPISEMGQYNILYSSPSRMVIPKVLKMGEDAPIQISTRDPELSLFYFDAPDAPFLPRCTAAAPCRFSETKSLVLKRDPGWSKAKIFERSRGSTSISTGASSPSPADPAWICNISGCIYSYTVIPGYSPFLVNGTASSGGVYSYMYAL